MMPGSEQLEALEALWRLKHREGRLPTRNDFRPEDLKPWLGNIAIVAVERKEGLRFRVTLSGTILDEYRGYGITGQYIDVLYGEQHPSLRHMATCVAERVPISFLEDNSRNSALYRSFTQLVLPLSEDGVVVDRLLIALYPAPANDRRDAAPLSAAG